MSQGSPNPKIRFLGQKVCLVACVQTYRHTRAKVNKEDTQLGFQEVFLQVRIGPIKSLPFSSDQKECALSYGEHKLRLLLWKDFALWPAQMSKDMPYGIL